MDNNRDKGATLGVGDEDDNLFVHGSVTAIQRVQGYIAKAEALDRFLAWLEKDQEVQDIFWDAISSSFDVDWNATTGGRVCKEALLKELRELQVIPDEEAKEDDNVPNMSGVR